MIAGAARRACSKRSRTRAAPTPTNISTNSEPDMEKKGTPASPATARARRVFPVPGGPISSTPLGIRAPSRPNDFGSRRNAIRTPRYASNRSSCAKRSGAFQALSRWLSSTRLQYSFAECSLMARIAQIVSTARYLPEHVVTNAELTAHFTALGKPTVIDRLAASTGITQRFHVPDNWVTSDLALPAAKEALKRAG